MWDYDLNTMIIDGNKKCGKCKVVHPISMFRKSNQRGDGYQYNCKTCLAILGKKWASKNKDYLNAYRRKWVEKNKERLFARRKELYFKNHKHMLDKMRERYRGLKEQIFEAYGHACACCGETRKEFLCVDHINGGGSKDRKGNPQGVYVRIRQQGFPKDKYRLMCHNCNMSLGFYGYCPHHPEITRPVLKRQRSLN